MAVGNLWLDYLWNGLLKGSYLYFELSHGGTSVYFNCAYVTKNMALIFFPVNTPAKTFWCIVHCIGDDDAKMCSFLFDELTQLSEVNMNNNLSWNRSSGFVWCTKFTLHFYKDKYIHSFE